MKLYLTFTKKTLFCILCAVLLFLFVFSKFTEAKGVAVKNADSHKKRTDFLSNLGCEIYDEEAKEKVIIIPNEFSDVYENYNDLQKTAGYDLSKYKNEECTVYTYRVKHYKPFGDDDYAMANLIVYRGRIIGGDISSAKIDGKMYPLKV